MTSTTIQEMVELIDARLTSRHDELAETIDRAADDVSGDEYVIQQYHGLLDHEIDQLAVLYQQYINDMIITIQQQITTDEQ